MRDEAHRFGITHHRNKRSKSSIHSELDAILGIGPKTKEKLLKDFKSVSRIKSAEQQELEKSIGLAAARKILSWRDSLLP